MSIEETGPGVRPDEKAAAEAAPGVRPDEKAAAEAAPGVRPDGREAADAAAEAHVEALHALILKCLEDGQAEEVVSIALAGRSAIADHMVVASGRSTRQVAALAQRIDSEVKTKLGRDVRIEGLASADWVLIDAHDVIVHLFRPEVRQFYALEKMWAFDADGVPRRAEGARP